MRLLALLEDPAGASARLRFEPFARALEADGGTVERCAIPRSGPARWRLLGQARAFDATLVARRLLQPWESAWLRTRARRLLADLDDALWLRDRAPFESRGRRWRLLALLRRCDAVFAGSRTLATGLREFGIDATLLPTPVSDRPAARVAGARDGRILLWIGQPATYRYLQAWSQAWQQVVRRFPRARLVVVGAGRAEDPLLPRAEFRAWTPEVESAALAQAALGLAPLPDDPWTRGKCAARLVTYLAAGLPAVASPVGAQAEVASECGGVLLVGSIEEAAARIGETLENPGRLARLEEGVALRLRASRSESLLWPHFARALTGATVARSGRCG